MKVLLTGATGFIGSHVARALVTSGHDVSVLIRPRANRWRIADIDDQMRVLEGDLHQHPPFRDLRPEACIHLAWYAEPGKYLHSEENLACLSQSIALVQELLAVGCSRILGAGTCFEYDTSVGTLTERSPTKPETLYAACKLALLNVLEQLVKRYEASLNWMRFFYLYGPQEDERRLVPQVIGSLLSGAPVATTPGEQIRDYLHVEDAASAVCAVLEGYIDGIVNIGSGQPITIKQLVVLLGETVGRPELLQIGERPYTEGDPMYVCANNDKLKALGWQPRFRLDEGLAHTVRWWQAGQRNT